MLNTPRFSPGEIREQLRPGDTVDWCGQPCRVAKIDLSRPRPVFLRMVLNPAVSEEVTFEEINDILGKSLRGRGADYLRDLRLKVKSAISELL